ncbi:hypothetical protein H2200_011821 [Cladophialophora chaetospira]|uniref:Uncharacterized protein n=1 Tax=Cladophialophora chaetospira TaxID=386627 RepID=A0AA39CCW0_9EURO|nr:hypothetical protein H2200_011821 [Cladophialophora chaetospira]
MDSLASADSWGAGPANHSPFLITEDSLISVPVLKPSDIARHSVSQIQTLPDGSSQPGQTKSARKSFSLLGSKSSSSSAYKTRNTGEFVMRRVPRREYLAHYAKDDNGKYIGSEEPAPDCILHGDDLVKYRGEAKTLAAKFENEINGGQSLKQDGLQGETVALEPKKKRGLFGALRKSDAGDSVIR